MSAIILATAVLCPALAAQSHAVMIAHPSSSPGTPNEYTPATSLGKMAQSYLGQLNPEMVEINDGLPAITLGATTDPALLGLLPTPLAQDERMFIGAIKRSDFHTNPPTMRKVIPLALIESPRGIAVYVNLRGDTGAFLTTDRIELAPPAVNGPISLYPGDVEGWFKSRNPANAYFKSYPYHMIYSPARLKSDPRMRRDPEHRRLLYFSDYVAQGTADVGGHPVLVQYSVDDVTGTVESTPAWYGMDCNGDGAIEPRSKTERLWQDSSTGAVIFKVGEHYLSPGRVDERTGRFTLVEQAPDNYGAFELKVGVPLPDFSFTDMTGKTHQLSEYRGKYVLLDFWELGCGPCRMEMPNLKSVYQQYHARGFEVLGFDHDEPEALDDVSKYIAQQGLAWVQASAASPQGGADILALISRRFRIAGYPTAILIDPNGVILSAGDRGEPGLRGDALAATVAELMSSPATSR